MIRYKKKKTMKKMSIAAKHRIVWEDINAGMSISQMMKKYADEWGISPKTANLYIEDAIKELYNKESKERIKTINAARLDAMYAECVSDDDKKNALKSIDLLNKTMGVYNPDSIDVDEQDDTLHIEFNF